VSSRRQFTLKPGWFGFVVMVRTPVSDLTPGDRVWGTWRRAGISDIAEIMRRLHNDHA